MESFVGDKLIPIPGMVVVQKNHRPAAGLFGLLIESRKRFDSPLSLIFWELCGRPLNQLVNHLRGRVHMITPSFATDHVSHHRIRYSQCCGFSFSVWREMDE